MSFARIIARGRLGIEAPMVSVEVFISKGLPSLSVVGLPEAAVRESKDRVRSALIHAGFEFPRHRVVINLGPADLPKEGGRYDLAIAIGLLAASEQIPVEATENHEFIGELSLSGELRGVNGVLAAAMAANEQQHCLVLAKANSQEAGLCTGLTALTAEHLIDVCQYLAGETQLEPAKHQPSQSSTQTIHDLADVRGQDFARRAIEIAAAGQHHMLMVGSPGSGKTMLAERLNTILPKLSLKDAMEIARIYSCRGQWSADQWRVRPFRAPHHTASAVALVGGGSRPLPGEISLAHHGILFLDEFPQFERRVLEVLREPLESAKIQLSRAAYQTTYPANFQLIAAMNPCPCGYAEDSKKSCQCTQEQISRYQNKISGPLLDRIDLQVRVQPVDHSLLLNKSVPGESSSIVRQRVVQAAQIQFDRQGCYNSQLNSTILEKVVILKDNEKSFIIKAADKLALSARGLHRLLRVSRTIADLQESTEVQQNHIAEALAFRLASKPQPI